MKLSAPIFYLKRRAKVLSRQEDIPLSKALDRIAVEEGYNRWSLLVARVSIKPTATDVFAQLVPGDLLLLGARPGLGKTLWSLELLGMAIKTGRRGIFFTLEYNKSDVENQCRWIFEDPSETFDRLEIDNSNTINADYIIERMGTAPRGTVAVIDYLQLLDQKRDNPLLMEQVSALKKFACAHGLIFVFLSQIDRTYELSGKSCPELEDVRLPNPLDLTFFNKACFLGRGEVRFKAIS